VVKLKSIGKTKILVTSALPYANGPIHCGHLMEYIQTDIFVRFLRLIGEDVLFVCADDTHGAAIEIKAKELGITPEKLIDDVFKQHTRDFSNFLISFDNYYTTNSPENKKYSDLIFEKLRDKGFIYKKYIEVTYCEHDKRTLPDRYVKGTCPKCGAEEQYGDVCEKCNAAYKTTDLINPYCAICRERPVRKSAEHYFFRLSAFSDRLKKWLDRNKQFQPEIKNFVYSWIKNGLEDWCISRDGPYFGFKIPGEEDKYYYVWLDAPIGYIASTVNYCNKNGLNADDYWVNRKTKIIHFIGKDIIYFHFLFWPAMLMGSGFNLPFHIPVHGFLTVYGEKMSKSRGTFFTAEEMYSKYKPEYLRFYYAKILGKNMSDVDLNFQNFHNSINNELVANLANFCYRVLSFANNNLDSNISKVDSNKKIMSEIKKKIKKIEEHYYSLELNEATREILGISSIGNKYLQEKEPWNLIKTDKEKASEVIGLAANIVKILSLIVKPILPKFSSEIEAQLNLKDLEWKDINFELKEHKISQSRVIFSKIDSVVETEIKKEESRKISFDAEEDVKRLGINAFGAVINGVKVKKKHEGLEKFKRTVKINPESEIINAYKELYKKVGAEVNSSIEYLNRIVQENKRLPTINTVVDSYNLVIVKRHVNAGAHDLRKIIGNPRLKIITTENKQTYIPLGQNQEEKIKSGEFACVDDKHVLCRLDVKQGEHTKIDKSTKNVFVYVQGNLKTSDEYLKEALKEICDNIIKFCGGTYHVIQAEEEVFPLNIKVAKIILVEDHPNADKLIILRIDLGREHRQIIAGIKNDYTKEELIGKKIAVLTNLKPATIRGQISNGMLLAGDDGKNIGLIAPKDSNPGDNVYFEGYNKVNKNQISYEDFANIHMLTKDGKVVYNGNVMKTYKEVLFVEKVVDNARIK